MADTKVVSAGVPWMTLMAFVLAVLKLAGVIELSWWWVFAPVWLPLLLVMPLVVIMLIAVVVVAVVGGLVKRSR